MRKIGFALTIIFSLIGIIIGLFIYGRTLFNPDMMAYYGINSPWGCIRMDNFPKYFKDFLMSLVVTSLFSTMLITTIIRFLFKKTPIVTNYMSDSFIRNDQFFSR